MATSLREGAVDDFRRPIFHLAITAKSSALPCVIDTGFNRSLMMPRWLATEYGFKPYSTRIVDSITLADGSKFQADRLHGFVDWFGESRRIDAQILPDAQLVNTYRGADQVYALMGTELLGQCLLSIDFVFRRVTIQRLI